MKQRRNKGKEEERTEADVDGDAVDGDVDGDAVDVGDDKRSI